MAAGRAGADGEEKMTVDNDPRNRLSHWFLAVQKVLPPWRYPRTEIVRVPDGCELLSLLDGQIPFGFDAFLGDLKGAAERVGGYPVFFRCDESSCKHFWLETCYVRGPLGFNVGLFVDTWFATNWFASPESIEAWAVREFVPVSPQVMTAFHGMPVGPERRYVVEDGTVTDHHPYWPLRALWEPERDFSQVFVDTDPPPPSEPPADLLRRLGSISAEPPEEVQELTGLAEAVGRELGGDWTVDFMHSDRGWLCIDAAVLADSWRATEEDRADWTRAIAAANR